MTTSSSARARWQTATAHDPNTNVTNGVANYTYPNDQPSTTLWYHDHSLGMTRNNVYAGPAGFWLIRERAIPAARPVLWPAPCRRRAPVAGEDLANTNLPATLVARESTARSRS